MQLAAIFARIFWGLGGILAAIGLIFGIERVVFYTGSETAPGQVVSVRTEQNEVPMMAEGTGFHYYPTIRFEPASGGSEVRFESPAGITGVRYEEGQEVRVRFHIDNPSRAFIDSPVGIFGLPGILFGIGLLFVLFGFVAGKGFDRKKY